MNDQNTTVAQLSCAIRQLVMDKNWGVNGEQNPLHIAMAMSVEMAELLEHFQWKTPEEVEALWHGDNPELADRIAQECADVFNYGLQLMYTLRQDITAQIDKKLAQVRARPADYGEQKQKMRDTFEEEVTASPAPADPA